MKRGPLFGIGAALFALAIACRVGGVGQGPAALVFGASAVAATAAYREVTGGCWAACNTGWVCNTETGRCEPDAREGQPLLLRRDGADSARSVEAQRADARAADAGAALAWDAASPAGLGAR